MSGSVLLPPSRNPLHGWGRLTRSVPLPVCDAAQFALRHVDKQAMRHGGETRYETTRVHHGHGQRGGDVAARSALMRRIAALMDTDEGNSDGQTRVAAFRQALQQLGWTEGRNIRIDLRWGGRDVERTRRFAAELVHLSSDAIFAYAKAQLAPLARETRMIPIVFCGASAPVEDGFIASFARPGGNYHGVYPIRAVDGRQVVGGSEGDCAGHRPGGHCRES